MLNHIQPAARILVATALGSVLLLSGVTTFAGQGKRILVVGHGPEQPVIQELARAYEKGNPASVIDIEWDRTLETVEMTRVGQADIAVSGSEESGLKATQVAWDGIAVIVNFANPLLNASTDQVQSLFTGKIRRWSDLDGADTKVEVIRRTTDQNINTGFEQTLGAAGKLVPSDKPARADQKALASVSGRDNTISYVSLKAAIEAQEHGTPIRILTLDQVEPGDPTVKTGRYKLRRPVLFLSQPSAHPLVESFTRFALSPEGQKILSKMYTPFDAQPVSPRQAMPSDNSSSPDPRS